MNQKTATCQGSADKVRELFSKKKLSGSSILKQAFSEKREHGPITKIHTPSKRSLLAFTSSSKKAAPPVSKEKLTNKKASLVLLAAAEDSPLKEEALHTSRSCYLERYRLANLDNLREAAQSHFKHSHQVTKWPFREFSLVERNFSSLKNISSSSQRKRYDIRCLNTKQTNPEEQEIKEKRDQWEEFIKLKEERHFHLGRITKYFTK